jgi:hypothetical protein
MEQVSKLFRGNNKLILGFNTFLPDGFKINMKVFFSNFFLVFMYILQRFFFFFFTLHSHFLCCIFSFFFFFFSSNVMLLPFSHFTITDHRGVEPPSRYGAFTAGSKPSSSSSYCCSARQVDHWYLSASSRIASSSKRTHYHSCKNVWKGEREKSSKCLVFVYVLDIDCAHPLISLFFFFLFQRYANIAMCSTPQWTQELR